MWGSMRGREKGFTPVFYLERKSLIPLGCSCFWVCGAHGLPRCWYSASVALCPVRTRHLWETSPLARQPWNLHYPSRGVMDILWVSHGLRISCTHFPLDTLHHIICTRRLLYRFFSFRHSPDFNQASVSIIMSLPKLQLFPGTDHQALLWFAGSTKVGLGVPHPSSLQQEKQMQVFPSYGHPRYCLVTHGVTYQFSLKGCGR